VRVREDALQLVRDDPRARKLDRRPNSSSSAIEEGESTGARQEAENAPSIVPSPVRRRTPAAGILPTPKRVAARRTPANASDAPGLWMPGRMSVRERAAAGLDDDFPAVLAALRRGLEDKDARKPAAVAVSYLQLVYGRQLQQPADEAPSDPLKVSAMMREQRDALKRRILAQHPHLVSQLQGEDIGEPEA
jgi:hypothetical protein